MYGDPPFSVLVGKTLTVARQTADDQIDFVCEDGSGYRLWHSQDCCENVSVESVTGDLEDLIGTPILVAEERTNDDNALPEDIAKQRAEAAARDEYAYAPESETWTFYTLRTIKGTVDIRWHGTSNGYYSERVDFSETSAPASSATQGECK